MATVLPVRPPCDSNPATPGAQSIKVSFVFWSNMCNMFNLLVELQLLARSANGCLRLWMKLSVASLFSTGSDSQPFTVFKFLDPIKARHQCQIIQLKAVWDWRCKLYFSLSQLCSLSQAGAGFVSTLTCLLSEITHGFSFKTLLCFLI